MRGAAPTPAPPSASAVARPMLSRVRDSPASALATCTRMHAHKRGQYRQQPPCEDRGGEHATHRSCHLCDVTLPRKVTKSFAFVTESRTWHCNAMRLTGRAWPTTTAASTSSCRRCSSRSAAAAAASKSAALAPDAAVAVGTSGPTAAARPLSTGLAGFGRTREVRSTDAGPPAELGRAVGSRSRPLGTPMAVMRRAEPSPAASRAPASGVRAGAPPEPALRQGFKYAYALASLLMHCNMIKICNLYSAAGC